MPNASLVLLCALGLLAAVAASAQSTATTPTDPRITSWFVAPSGCYARLYPTEAAKDAGTPVTTWSRGAGTQTLPTYAGVMQVSYAESWVYLRASGLGYHVMGPWYLNAARPQLFDRHRDRRGAADKPSRGKLHCDGERCLEDDRHSTGRDPPRAVSNWAG